MKNIACRFHKVGPGGFKCPCCNEFHGKSKGMLNRITRRRLNIHFGKEVRAELNSCD